MIATQKTEPNACLHDGLLSVERFFIVAFRSAKETRLATFAPRKIRETGHLFSARYLLTLAIFATLLTASSSLVSAKTPTYNQDVRPILANHCFACHGRDMDARKADLRLDVREDALSSAAFVAGDPTSSELIRRITSTDQDVKMPPPDTGHALTAVEIETLTKWIAAGAEYQAHWSFVTPHKTELPKSEKSWGTEPLDAYVLSKLEQQGMQPSAEAGRAAILRRVSLDLTGLPPTIDEIDAFLEDQSEDAYQRVVDRLLDSDAFGEHWAKMWLDLARYADTKGYEKDRHRDIWRYRGWVVGALNRDMPYDEFTIEQLAGDLLPNRTDDQILATAFHRNTMTNDEGGTDNEEFRVAAVRDRVDTTLQVWMGLTMGCAKCHSHKYDPISINDYYSFYALFNQSQDADNESPFWTTPTASQAEELNRLKSEVTRINAAINVRPAGFNEAFAEWEQMFKTGPLWQPLQLASHTSEQNVKLASDEQGNIVAQGERPEKDVWTLTFAVPEVAGGDFKSLRLDHLPKAIGGGEWPDANVAIRELTVERIDASGQASPVKLANARASFSQTGWQVAAAIDGKPDAGWAISPKFNEQQTAVFDFVEPVSGGQIRVTLEQQFGQSLLLARSRFSVSQYPTPWLRAEVTPNLMDVFARQVHTPTMGQYNELAAARQQLIKHGSSLPKTPVMLELGPDKQRPNRLLSRGNFLDPGELVSPSVLTMFGPLPDPKLANRLGVAQWLMAVENPLTARVMVNRLWARLFGVGLVETEEDFGTQGLMPTHPELLDWLAVDFREHGWSIKSLLRRIVLSSTYRQSSVTSSKQLGQDPRNRWLGRGARFRLSAETVRDQALAASGLLTRKLGGPSVMPPQPGGIWKSTYSGEDWVNAIGPDRYRRGLYTYMKRTSPYPAMSAFDAGSGEVCQIRRVRTNTPIQALITLNDTVFVEAAGALAKKMQQNDDSLSAQLVVGFRSVLGRRPTSAELGRLESLYETILPEITDGDALLKAAGLETGDPGLVAIANVLFSLDETLMKP